MHSLPLASRGLRPLAELAASKPHGDRLRYMAGCRCADCRAANCAYKKQRAAARKAGDWNGIVSAERAREHIRNLSRAGIGLRAIECRTDLGYNMLGQIRAGKKLQIRARTERKILAVTTDMRSDGALVSSAKTHRLLRELLEEGFTQKELAKRLGYRHEALQFGEERVTVRNAWRVEQLHRKLMA